MCRRPWTEVFQQPASSGENARLKAEVARLTADLKGANEEHDNLKKGCDLLCETVWVKCAFMAEYPSQFWLSGMCRVLRIQRSGFYARKAAPNSARAFADELLLADIKKSFEDS